MRKLIKILTYFSENIFHGNVFLRTKHNPSKSCSSLNQQCLIYLFSLVLISKNNKLGRFDYGCLVSFILPYSPYIKIHKFTEFSSSTDKTFLTVKDILKNMNMATITKILFIYFLFLSSAFLARSGEVGTLNISEIEPSNNIYMYYFFN